MKEFLLRIEILTAALVIGVLGILAVVAVSGARAQARDAVRLSDVRQLQAGVELYFNSQNEYPVHEEYVALGLPQYRCLSSEGFSAACSTTTQTVYQSVIPLVPEQGLKGTSSCSGARNAYCYVSAGSTYGIAFELERKNPILGLQKGVNCATPVGFRPGACELSQ